jgi:hypothetical protein
MMRVVMTPDFLDAIRSLHHLAAVYVAATTCPTLGYGNLVLQGPVASPD